MSSPRSISALRFELGSLAAMSLAVPATPGHVNKHPFTGVLTKIDRPSDSAPQGSGGKRVLLTRKAAAAALESLLGMGVGFTPKLDGHDATRKIGVITAADIKGNDLQIAGFFYAADFPNEVARIRTDQAAMGFSFEAQRILIEDAEADPLVITACVFTGAAVLQKGRGAYLTTSLAASAAGSERKEAMEIVKLDPYVLRILRTNHVETPWLDLSAGGIKIAAAAGHNFEDFEQLLAQKVADPRERIQVKMQVLRAFGNPRGVTGNPVGLVR
ncbi:MAG: hypothetical protein ACLQME_12550 [Alphaproteobacteria bacterium]